MSHVPMRTCVGCRTVRPVPELVRLARSSAGQVTLDTRNQLPGRGAWLCRGGVACLEQARRRRALERALRCGSEQVNYEALAAATTRLSEEEQQSPR